MTYSHERSKRMKLTIRQLENIKHGAKCLYKGKFASVSLNKPWRDTIIEICDQSIQLKDDLHDERRLREKLADLLERTANALKGQPAPLHLHDWSDLPKVATQLKAENEAWREAGEDAVKQLGSIVGLMGITALLIGGDDGRME
jgi:hypothetical protein